MKLKVQGISDTVRSISESFSDLLDDQAKYLNSAAEDIKERAKHYSPVTEFDLEGAMSIPRAQRDTKNGITIQVGVDRSGISTSSAVNGVPYEEWVHDNMVSPDGKTTGTIPRNDATKAKGSKAGGRFLTRAFEDFENKIFDETQRIAGRHTE